jgi:hypothetical protein
VNLTLAAISYGITLFALVLLAVRVRTLLAIYKKGAADPTRGNDKGTRLRMALREIFGHTKMFNFPLLVLRTGLSWLVSLFCSELSLPHTDNW